jgi:ABC-type multidrug transport system fused ATPase/permease subunit
MDSPIGFWAGLGEIYRTVSAARRRQFYALLALMFAGAFAEIATIGAVIPFLSLLSNPQSLERFPIVAPIFSWLASETAQQRLVAVTAVFAAVVVASGAVRFELARLTQHFAFDLNHELMFRIQRLFLWQPYSFHIERSTSALIAAIDKIEVLVFEALIPLIQAVIGGFIALFIVGALIAVDPLTALVAAAAFSIMYVLVSAVTKRRLTANSVVVARGFDERMKILQESFGGIRDVIIDGSQAMYVELFDLENSKLNRARANTTVISSAPRFVIETVGILAITIIALWESQRRGGLATALPVLGAIAIGAQRLLPLVQQVYRGWSTAAGYLSVVGQTGGLLRLPESRLVAGTSATPLPLKKGVDVDNIAFAYRTRKRRALEGISFHIPAGSTVALVGETGSGKSTLADILMGLIEPDEGAIRIDGVALTAGNRRNWQCSIAHVPQAIFLADATIAQNIALGCPGRPLDMDKAARAAAIAQLAGFVDSLPEGYDTTVGERGIRLSGGQRQRLGLARAIYKESPVLVLDEATSALDEATEAAVIDGLEALRKEGRTIIIIAHRRSTVARADLVVRLDGGRLADVGTVEQILGAGSSWRRPRRAGSSQRGGAASARK